MRFLKSRLYWGTACFRGGPGDCGNVRDQRGIVRVSVAFVTSGSMVRYPPVLEHSGQRDWRRRDPQAGRERGPLTRAVEGALKP